MRTVPQPGPADTVLLCRSDRESKREQLERMVSTEAAPLTPPDVERLNQTVTCAEPSSPCREAAKGKAEQWRP